MRNVLVLAGVLAVLLVCVGCSRRADHSQPTAPAGAESPGAPVQYPAADMRGLDAPGNGAGPIAPPAGNGTVTLTFRHGSPVDTELTGVTESECPADTEFLEGEPIIAEVAYADVYTSEEMERLVRMSSSGYIPLSVGCEVVASDPTPPATHPRRRGTALRVKPLDIDYNRGFDINQPTGTKWIWLNAAVPGLQAGRYTVVGKAVSTTAEPVRLTIEPRSREDMAAYIRGLGTALRSGDDATRKRALMYLAFSGSQEAVQHLVDDLSTHGVLNEDATNAFRYVWATVDCAEALTRAAEQHGPQLLSPLLDLFAEPTERTLRAALKWLHAPAKETRGFAAYVVSKHHSFGYDALNPLLERLRNDPSSRVREGIARNISAGVFPQPEATQGLIAAVKDPAPAVSVAAIRSLSYRKDMQAVPTIIDAMLKRGFEESEAAARALGDLKAEQAIPALGKSMQRRWKMTWGPGYEALSALQRMHTATADAEIKASYPTCEEPVRSAAAAYLLGEGDDSVRKDLAKYIREAPADRVGIPKAGPYTVATSGEICRWVSRALQKRELSGPPDTIAAWHVDTEAWANWLAAEE